MRVAKTKGLIRPNVLEPVDDMVMLVFAGPKYSAMISRLLSWKLPLIVICLRYSRWKCSTAGEELVVITWA